MIPFLEYVAMMGFDDARKVLKSFEGTYIPAEFAKREKLLREKFEARLAEERKKKPTRSVGGIASMFGVKSQVAPDGTDPNALAEGEMLWDQIRKRGQKQYELNEKRIKEEGQKWLDDMAAEEKKVQEESLKSMKGSFLGFFGAGGSGSGEAKK
jgi:mitochondrial import inner membrane translocase subunit TIM50